MIDTAKVTDRRQVRFETLDDVRRDVESLADAERSGRLRSSGNWTLGQSLGHLAAWIDYAYDGYPVRKAPFFIRWIVKLRKQSLLNGKLPQGVKIPGVAGGTAAWLAAAYCAPGAWAAWPSAFGTRTSATTRRQQADPGPSSNWAPLARCGSGRSMSTWGWPGRCA